jgi:hypothetical protein
MKTTGGRWGRAQTMLKDVVIGAEKWKTLMRDNYVLAARGKD